MNLADKHGGGRAKSFGNAHLCNSGAKLSEKIGRKIKIMIMNFTPIQT
jgi:hypothetical protein